MRLGLNYSLQHHSPEEWAKKNYELGVKATSFPIDSHSKIELIDAYKKAATEYDIMIAEVGVWVNPVANDPIERENAIQYCINQLKLADYIGARCCVNVTGAFGTRWDGPYKENFSEEAWQFIVLTIQRIIDGAKPTNTYYSIEPMPWMIPSNIAEYLRLIQEVDRERFAVHMDLVNLITSPKKYFYQEEFIKEIKKSLGEKIKSCHLKDIHLIPDYTWQLKEVECGKGELNIEAYIKMVNELDLDMPILIEHLPSENAYRKSFAYVKKRLEQSCF